MRRPLRRRVDPRPDESAASLASRLAARNGTGLRRFCHDMGISPHSVHDGRPAAVGAVAELAGHDPGRFASSMLTRLGGVDSREWSYRGQSLTTGNLGRSCRRACPLCLAEDLAEGGLRASELASARSVWRVLHLRTCMAHGVALVEADEEVHRRSTYDNAQVYQGLLRRLPEVCEKAVRREPSAFEQHLLRRLDTGTGGVGWLDAKPLWAVALLVEHVGTAALFGRSPGLDRLTGADWWDAGKAGFEALVSGPEGITPILDEIHRTFVPPRAGPTSPGKSYGQLWRWVEKIAIGPEFDDVRDVMREHALSRVPLAAGTVVLGRVLEARRVHSLRSVHVETGRDERRFRKVLASHGLLPAGHEGVHPNGITFDADRVAHLVARYEAPMMTQQVLDYLGVAVLRPLIDGGVLKPLMMDRAAKDGQYEFARDDVEGLVADLLRHAAPLKAMGEDHVDLLKASKVMTRKLADVIALVRDGRLSRVWHLADRKGLRSVVISRTEAKAFMVGPDHNALARHQVVKRMRVYHVAVQHLINKGKLPSMVLPSPRGGRPATYVTEAALAEFEARYVTLTEMARTRGMRTSDVKRELVSRGIEPVLSPQEYFTGFYLRSDV